MIITPPVLPANYVNVEQVQLMSDSEFKNRIKDVELCRPITNDVINRVAIDAEGLYNAFTYIDPRNCEEVWSLVGTHAEYSKGNYDAEDVFAINQPVELFNHTFVKQLTNLLPVLPVPTPPVYSDFPSIINNHC